VTTATPKDLVYQNDYTTTTYYDSNNSRILIGQLPDGSYGMQVSLPEVDVTTATPSQLLLNSNQNIFKIIGTGVMQQTVIGGDYEEVKQPHGLGFAPIVIGFSQAVSYANSFTGSIITSTRPPLSTSFAVPSLEFDQSTGGIAYFIQMYTDTVNVTGRFFSGNPDTDGTYQLTYYFLQETATPA
jgi:hypothetical protein